MRILLNGLTMLKPRTGVGQYTARLAAALQSQLAPDEFAIYPPSKLAARMKPFLPSGFGGGAAKPTLKSRFRGMMKTAGYKALQWHFARHAKQIGATIVHEPNFLPLSDSVPTVVTVHDLSAILHPEWHPADRAREHGRKLEHAVRNARYIITDTEQVKRELIAAFSVSPAQITAIPLGVSPEFRPTPLREWKAKFELPERYFLSVGTIEPRKNLLTVMKAFAALPVTVRRECPLLLAGPWGWRSEPERDYYEREGRSAGIRHLGYVPDTALPALYSQAAALLYPSHYEGFGLPPLEAAACGTVSLCNAGTLSVREVMGSHAMYCEGDWRDAMLKVCFVGHAENRNSLMKYAASFTWPRAAEQTIRVYRDAPQQLQRAA